MSVKTWQRMMEYQQELHKLSRAMLTQGQKQALTASQREVLARLYLGGGESTPLALSRETGMKKEAVSRTLKQLLEKELISKKRHPQDERSWLLFLTEAGRQALNESYSAILKPLYDLRRQMGDGAFENMFALICKANEPASETGREENRRN